MSVLGEILEYYGMPYENIDDAIEQIAETYGASRYLEGVRNGAAAVHGLGEEIKNETANTEHADNPHDDTEELPMDGDVKECAIIKKGETK